MDEQLRQRLNRKLSVRDLSNNPNPESINEGINNKLDDDSLMLQEEIIPRQRNFSVLEEVVTDTNKLALVFLFSVAVYALYVISKNNK